MLSFNDRMPANDRPEPRPETKLRPLRPTDLDAVLEIERGFNAPWTREMFLQELANTEMSTQLVAEFGGVLRGYIMWWYVADEVHIVNVAVHAGFRRRGVARQLLAAVFTAAADRGMTIATLEVRFHNNGAITLYESLGFQKVAIRKAYYADNGEDAVVMLKALGADN